LTPSIVIAGVRSGVGKTTIATGIMGALTKRGKRVQPFKAGPDYIDPSYHKLAAGIPSRNLDSWLLPHKIVSELFYKASQTADISIVEGVMGIFDGHSNLDEFGSTAQLAKLLHAPVVLIADASKVARSVAAEILGYQLFDPELNIAGVILNGIGSPRHLEFCKPQIEKSTGIPVIGYMPRRQDLVQPERHLGLIPTTEGTVVQQWYDSLISQTEETIDLEAICDIASTAQLNPVEPYIYPASPQPKTAVIAVAKDEAFSFYYQDSLDLLESWGAEIVEFSPLKDSKVPERCGGIYIGGGFPELFAQELSENKSMLISMTERINLGIPIYAECGGLMYLGHSLSDMTGQMHPMVQALPLSSSMKDQTLHLGYRELEALCDSPIMKKGQVIKGHEFHWSVLENNPELHNALYTVVDQDNRFEGFRNENVWASYVHVHLASDPSLAKRFVEVCSRLSRL
jgi:cobyrinic acid a,c-diamide synthase